MSMSRPRKTSKMAIKELAQIFDLLDIDGNGDLDLSEFKLGLKTLNVSLKQEDAIQLFQSIDTEGVGTIDKDTFISWLKEESNSEQVEEIRMKIRTALHTQSMVDPNEELAMTQAAFEITRKQSRLFRDDDDEHLVTSDVIRSSSTNKTLIVHPENSTNGSIPLPPDYNQGNDFRLATDSEGSSESLSTDDQESLMAHGNRSSNDDDEHDDQTVEQMMKKMEELEDREKRRVSRSLEKRAMYRPGDDAAWTKEEFADHQNEMIAQLHRLTSENPNVAELATGPGMAGANEVFNAVEDDNITTLVSHTPTGDAQMPMFVAQGSDNSSFVTDPMRRHSGSTRRTGSTGLDTYETLNYSQAGPRDISQITAPVDPSQQYVRVGGDGRYNFMQLVFYWYISAFTKRESFIMVMYHGANLFLSIVSAGTMVTLFVLSVALLPICCSGIIFVYLLFESARSFAHLDISLSLYFFPSHHFPKFSLYIPVSHAPKWRDKFNDYVSDPHMLKIVFYTTFIKLPMAFAVSGVCLTLLSGVISVLLSPLVYLIRPRYFEDEKFCLFGVVEKSHGDTDCKGGWAVVSFGDTLGAFLLFLPILPFTIHLCRYGARALFNISCNFLTVEVGTTQDTPIRQPYL